MIWLTLVSIKTLVITKPVTKHLHIQLMTVTTTNKINKIIKNNKTIKLPKAMRMIGTLIIKDKF